MGKEIVEAGRELDILIADKFFGITALDTFSLEKTRISVVQALEHMSMMGSIPHYSTDIEAAWSLVDKITSMQNVVCVNQSMYVGINGSDVYGYDCSINANGPGYGTLKWTYRTGKSAAHAICLAALESISKTDIKT